MRETLSVSLAPDSVEFKGAGVDEKYPISDTPCAFGIESLQSKLEVEVRNDRLMLGLSPSDKVAMNVSITTTQRRAGGRYYPEVLIPVAGYVQIIPRS